MRVVKLRREGERCGENAALEFQWSLLLWNGKEVSLHSCMGWPCSG